MNGSWARALVDTGATMSFGAKKFATENMPDLVQTATSALNIRLGDATSRPVNSYIDTNVAFNNKEVKPRIWLMPLPSGIDVILGLDWMRLMNCMLDPPNRRIILTDGAAQVVASIDPDSSPIHPIPTHAFLAHASETSKKQVKNDVFCLSDTLCNSEVMVASTNTFHKILKEYKTGNLDHEFIESCINTNHASLDTGAGAQDEQQEGNLSNSCPIPSVLH